MSYHEGSNWQAKKEDAGKPLYTNMEKKYPIDPEFIAFIKAERNAISKEMLNDEWWLCIPPAKRVVIENILIAYDQMAATLTNLNEPTP